ncbi:hypothetical protein CANTEDRAFT_115604 [Yamadazyma tenuis ATCC 10573]|uniref:Uncharacterized protein n=2 Tax=Candida tenuis TaxID=2315449 RepID=G3BB42_CANTC|nr:uncharacterized protein CANTEDRAFT_115604 [Yamadazyma tenuis ATCC 10573]XP_006688965.1 uncharacterized protein CANTEDRAFT_115604 [Yamadazyma tenuis ATCC 10573]EGV62794.1 hypothetical protein CANTEDRAFT_115604 [Yamadazyma tenuis ATCC 10573]EGV62795.1 hypothetical protein CANTEDRAFT_115604 [Yamadazyma tenuis ATCC 10573]
MSNNGLVSRWATSNDLVEKATHQDSSVSPHHSYHPKTPPPAKSPSRTTKLESIWADAVNEPSPSEPSHSSHSSRGKASHSNSRPARHRGGKAPLQTPPSSSEAMRPPTQDEEPLAPMTDAARSFAARLGTNPKPQNSTKTSTKTPTKTPIKTHPPRNPPTHHTPKNSYISDDAADAEDSESPKQMSAAAMAFASRLGISSSAPPPSHKSGKPPRSSHRSQEKSPRHDTPKKLPNSRNLPPKNRKNQEAEQLEKEEAARQAELEKERYKAEIEQLVKEMESSELNWADIED